jgi:Protein of unknown function (DUF2934)
VGWETGVRESNASVGNTTAIHSPEHALDLGWGIRFGVGHYSRPIKALEFMCRMAPNVPFGRTSLQVRKGVVIMANRSLKTEPIKSTTSAKDNPVEAEMVEDVNENTVAALAYQLWQQRACPIGPDQEDWFRAESQLKARKVQPTKAA